MSSIMTRGKYKKIWDDFENNPEAFCHICSNSFPNGYFLKIHNEQFCHICSESFPSAHFLKVHNENFCHLCKKQLPSAYMLEIHNETFCHICAKTLPSAYFMKVHNIVFHQSKSAQSANPANLANQKSLSANPAVQIEIAQRHQLQQAKTKPSGTPIFNLTENLNLEISREKNDDANQARPETEEQQQPPQVQPQPTLFQSQLANDFWMQQLPKHLEQLRQQQQQPTQPQVC